MNDLFSFTNTINVDSMTIAEKASYYGIKSLVDKELISQLLGVSIDNKDVDKVLKIVQENADRTDLKNLLENNGLSEKKSAMIASAFELARRYNIVKNKGSRINMPVELYNAVRHFYSPDQEVFVVVGLDGVKNIVFTKVVTVGILNKTLVHPREVFADAIDKRCAAIAIAHNHPSGDLSLSTEDRETTKRLVAAGHILGIEIIDHIIFSDENFYSFKENGYL